MKMIAFSVALALAVGGCSLQNGGPTISDRAWLLNSGSQTAATPGLVPGKVSDDYLPAVCPSSDKDAAAMMQPQINACVYAMVQLIDVKYAHFQDQLFSSASNMNLATDIGLLGLSTAGSLVSGGATQILHAAAAGVTGLHTSINQDLLYSNTITTILLQMEADRSAQKKQILDRLAASSKNAYTSMYDAANDLFFYARAGSWTHALLSIQKSAAGSNGNAPGGSAKAAALVKQ